MSLALMTRTAYKLFAAEHSAFGGVFEKERREGWQPYSHIHVRPDIFPFEQWPEPVNSREEWEAYQYNPPALIWNAPNRPFWIPGTVPDEREEVIPKPTWEDILRAGASFMLPGELAPDLALSRAERHERCEAHISRIVYGASVHRHEHYVKDRISENATRAAYRGEWVAHMRQRFHQIEGWLEEITSPAFTLQGWHVEPLCAFDYDADELWTAKQWTPPTERKAYTEVHAIEEDPHPGPPPGWKPSIERVGPSGPDGVSFRVMVPFRAKLSVASLDDVEHSATVSGEDASGGAEVLVQAGDVDFSVRFTGSVRHGGFRLSVLFPRWERIETQEFSADVRG